MRSKALLILFRNTQQCTSIVICHLAWIDPCKTVWWLISCKKREDDQLIIERSYVLSDPTLCFGVLLNGVSVTTSPGCEKFSSSFIREVMWSLVDTYDCDADGIATLRFEYHRLILQIIDNTINLFDHCLCENLGLNADFNGSNRPSTHCQPGFVGHWNMRQSLSETSVSAPSPNPSTGVRRVHDRGAGTNIRNIFGRAPQHQKVFKQPYGYMIAVR